MSKRIKLYDIENGQEALGFRKARDNVLVAVREGAMTLPGSIVLSLIGLLESYDASLKAVPRDWLMTNGELAAVGII